MLPCGAKVAVKLALYARRSGVALVLVSLSFVTDSSRAPRGRAVTAESGITAAGENRFRVQRAIVDELLREEQRSPPCIFVPHEEDGRVVGVKLYGIRSNGRWARLGLRNGDLLRAINGLELARPETAPQAYAQLRAASELSVSLERGGRPMTVSYVIE